MRSTLTPKHPIRPSGRLRLPDVLWEAFEILLASIAAMQPEPAAVIACR
jgi:hypothetical protein